jgi:hypothetical protein
MHSRQKRVALRVPSSIRNELNKLSKADLMEIAFDFAIRDVGEDKPLTAAYAEVVETHRILCLADGRRPVKLWVPKDEDSRDA